MTTASHTYPNAHNAADTITLDETARHRRRIKMVSDNGIEFLLDLPEARLLRHGEAIVLDDGREIEVIAEPEALYEIYADNPHHLLKLSWQLGNRHLPSQIMEDHIRIRQDRVIKEMIEGLGGTVKEITDSFDPEGGAYSGHSHSHANSHDHKHGHDHD